MGKSSSLGDTSVEVRSMVAVDVDDMLQNVAGVRYIVFMTPSWQTYSGREVAELE